MLNNNNTPILHDIVLVGGGHSHVEVMRQFAMIVEPGVRITLVSKDRHTPYSGMLPGLLAGHYQSDEAHIDLHRLCRATGIRFIHDAVTGVDVDGKRLTLAERPSMPFDLVSFDTGSSPKISSIVGAGNAFAVKPVDQFRHDWARLETDIDPAGALSVVVVGGGAGGVELALSLQHRLTTNFNWKTPPAFTLVTAENDILFTHVRSVRERFKRVLSARGVRLLTNARVNKINERSVHTENGDSIESDATILVTGAQAPSWYSQSALQTDAHGFVSIRDTLQSTSHDFVFAAGDCASLLSQALPKAGVYAVRQGPVLARNLRAFVKQKRLESFNPQARILALISTGDQYAVASRGRFSMEGEWVWRWKNWIDKRWMVRYQDFEMPHTEGPHPAVKKDRGFSKNADQATAEVSPMRCGGCGAKVPQKILNDVLTRVQSRSGQTGFSGSVQVDDAAVIDIPAGHQLVQSVDHFRAFIDDPFRFAQVTTNHCLNDLYAMGARPTSALATAIVPYGADNAVRSDLEALLHGAITTLTGAGAQLVGGHSAEGQELSFGLSVNGVVLPGDVISKGGWCEGDVLILTKPLGTGVILAADMNTSLDGDILEAAMDTMLLSNREAVDIFRQFEVSACTDITGFGLYGHALEMVRASGLGAVLDLARVPTLASAHSLLKDGFASTLAPSNRAMYTSRDAARDADTRSIPGFREGSVDIAFDPQTAGGLLGAIPQQHCDACVRALRDKGYVDAAWVGSVKSSAVSLQFDILV